MQYGAWFIDIDNRINTISKMFSESSKPIFIIGKAGSGKTTLALRYAVINRLDYEIIYPSELKTADLRGFLKNFVINNDNKDKLFIFEGFHSYSQDNQALILKYFYKKLNFKTIFISQEPPPILFHNFFSLDIRYIKLEKEIRGFFGTLKEQFDDNENIKKLFKDLIFEFGATFEGLKLLYETFENDPSRTNAMSEITSFINNGTSNLLIVTEKNKFRVIPIISKSPENIITPNQEILRVIPFIFIKKYNIFWRKQLDEFEYLLNNGQIKEGDFQQFFESYPHFLKGIEYSKVVSHPILEKDTCEGELIPDFFLQPLNSNFCDIVELKKPEAKVFIGEKKFLKFSYQLEKSLAQIKDYRNYFDDKLNREKVYNKYGLTAFKPNLSLIIGRDHVTISEEKIRLILNDMPRGINIITYDQLFKRMCKLVETYNN